VSDSWQTNAKVLAISDHSRLSQVYLRKIRIVATLIYDTGSELRSNPLAGLFVSGLGLTLLTWYLHGIFDDVAGDIHNFPASFGSSPTLTLVFALIKGVAYVGFGMLCADDLCAGSKPFPEAGCQREVAGSVSKSN
jgi:hypothetical protein